jgi:hypothetical protein
MIINQASLLSFPTGILAPDVLPEKGDKLKTWFEDDANGVRTYYIDKAYRRGNGKPDHFRRKTTDPVQHAKHIVEANSINCDSSLTSTRFSEIINAYRSIKGDGGFSTKCYDRAVDALGRLYPDKLNFSGAYAEYTAKLGAMGLAVNTVNNHKIIVRTVCNFGFETGKCGKASVRNWLIEQGNERNRILSTSEELAFMNTLAAVAVPGRPPMRSHIFEAVKFALRNPIRKCDLFNLTRKNLKMESHNGKVIWVVQFQAPKTRRNIKITTLPNVGMDLVSYVQGLPADCPWMFPMLEHDGEGIGGLKKGTWKKIIDADRHFNYVLEKAGIDDFHFHDLKHCAITYMLKQGYTYDALGKLGIERSEKTQALYDNRSQVEIVAKLAERRLSVGYQEAVNV